MKSLASIIGVLLIIFGVAAFSYRYFTYTTNEKIVEIGNVEVTAEQEKAIVIPPAVAGIAIAGGIILVIIGLKRKS